MNHFDNFIIVDDEKLNNTLCKKIISKTFPTATTQDFTNPLEGFQHIKDTYTAPTSDLKTVLLLDIMMPEMNAWEFLEEFDKLNDEAKKRVKIYVLSSSVDKNDMARAGSNPYVEYYLIKPLTAETLHLLVRVLNKRLSTAAAK